MTNAKTNSSQHPQKCVAEGIFLLEVCGIEWNVEVVNGRVSMEEFIDIDDDGTEIMGEKLGHDQSVDYWKKHNIQLFCTFTKNLYC